MRTPLFAHTRQSPPRRTACAVLALSIGIGGASPAAQRDIALPQANQEALVALAKEARGWVKEEERLDKDLKSRAKKATENAVKTLRKQDPGLLQAYEDQRKAIYSAIESLSFERRLTETLLGLGRNGMPGRIGLQMDRANQASGIDRYRKAAANDLLFAQREAARAIASPHREIRAESVAAYEESMRYLDRWEQRYDAYLMAAGARPVAEFLTRQAERLRLQRENAERRKLEDARRGDLLGAGFLMLLGAPFVVALLQSGTSTPEDQAMARQQLAEMKMTETFLCGIRGGSFLDGGPYAVGVCTK